MVPNRIVDRKPDELPEQEIELHAFHQMPLRTDPIEHMEQHRSKEFLWSNRRAAKVRIELAELPRQLVQRRIRAMSRITRSG